MHVIRLNIPQEKELQEIEIPNERFKKLEPQLSGKNLVKIDDYYFNTAYIVDIYYKNSKEETKKLLNNYASTLGKTTSERSGMGKVVLENR